MLPHTYVRHRSARSLVRDFMKEGETYEDVLGDSHSFDEWVDLVNVHGYWAFVRIQKGRAAIHWYARRDVAQNKVAHMLGHELGHITGERLDGMDEELRADEYGDVVAEVLRLLTRARRAPATRPRGRGAARRNRRASSQRAR